MVPLLLQSNGLLFDFLNLKRLMHTHANPVDGVFELKGLLQGRHRDVNECCRVTPAFTLSDYV